MNNIWVAASDNDIELVKQYISSGKTGPNDKDESGYTPIHAAASYGHRDLLKYLVLDAKGDINVIDNDGDTPLHVVEDLETTRLLLELGAQKDLKNSSGQTPLEKLLEEDEFPEVIEYLTSLEPGTSNQSSLPSNAHVSYSYEAETELDTDPERDSERRQMLEKIMSSENPEEGLRDFIQNALGQFESGDAANEVKRRRNN